MKVEEGYFRPSKYGSKKFANTELNLAGGHTITILTGGATFASLVDSGLPAGTDALTWHGISGAQPAGEKIYAVGYFVSVRLSAGSIECDGPLYERVFTGKTWYVRPSGGAYGAEDGTSYATAWDGFTNIDWTAAGVQPGDLLYICGTHTEAFAVGGSGTAPIGYSLGSPITIRGDYPGDPGVINSADLRNTGFDCNSKNYITIHSLSSIDAVVDCFQFRGTSTGIVTYNLIATGSGNQGIQHEDTASVTHNNPYCNDNADDGVSGHGNAIIIINEGTFSNNGEGINVIEDVHCTVSGTTIFSSNTSYDIWAVNATTDGSCWIDITGATLSGNVRVDNEAKLILRNCTVNGPFEAAPTVSRKGFLELYNTELAGTILFDDLSEVIAENSILSGVITVNSANTSIDLTDCTVSQDIQIRNSFTATRTVFTSTITPSIGNTSTFTECLITSWGANIYGIMTFNECRIQDNAPVNGTANVNHCLFTGNGSIDHLLDVVSGGTLNVKYSVFKGMIAGKFGIAARTGSTVTINGCTFVGASKVGKGLFTQVNVTANNCIFTDLESGFHQAAGTAATYNCVFYDNTDDTVGTVTQNNSQTGDPALTAVGSNDFSLGTGSSAIGNGKDLGASFKEGIASAVWGNGTTEAPVVTLKKQATAWDIGAYIS